MISNRSRSLGCTAWLALAAGIFSPLPAAAIEVEALDRYVFVANRASSEISVIDARDDRVVERLDLGLTPDSFLLSGSLGLLVAAHAEARRLSILDVTSRRVVEVIETGFRPELIQLNGDGDLLAAADPETGRLLLAGLDDPDLRQEIDGLPAPSDLVFDREGGRLFVASGRESRIDVVSLEQGGVTKVIDLGAELPGIADLVRTPGGGIALALHGQSGEVSVIDLPKAERIAKLRVPGPALRGFPSANSQFFLIPNGLDGSVSSVSTWTHRETFRLPAAPDVQGVNLGMFDTLGFAISRSRRQAVALDLQDGRRDKTLELPGTPETGVSAEGGTKLYVALSSSDQVAVIDLMGRRLLRLIDGVGERPWAVNRAGGLSYCH
ncbi:MAG: hypothetical protein QNJ30_14550 [Kiloniellales bacterium]|nr:hypothetical protein [Kiloniellales bacterium]